ncbi:MAG: hypothetical protein ACM3ML_08925 [Micromonosporaceae bacterium]
MSGLVDAAGATPARAGTGAMAEPGVAGAINGSRVPISVPAVVTGPGWAGGIKGSNDQMLPPAMVTSPAMRAGAGLMSESDVGERPGGTNAAGVLPADGPAGWRVEVIAGEELAGPATVAAADALTASCGLVAVASAVSFTCSPLVADFGTAITARSSTNCPARSVLMVHDRVCPLGHTVKCGAVGVAARPTVTFLMSPPEARSQIA